MNTAERIDLQQWIDLGSPEVIPTLGSRVVETARGPVAVFRTSDDHYYALLDRCPHKGGPLSEGMVHGHWVSCPLHAWQIDLEQGEARAPDQGCVPRFLLKIDRGRLYLGLLPLPSGKRDRPAPEPGCQR